ncbi:hypothetical protein NPIL_136741 [Nephila pilipes]|uniref:Uncharacterized protein n=1 Tax=Nephila pilipes TaxID=299642 RepID=A0A8X6TSX2_NEPPI|nr:hypothetical protein NPIL_136741 [Nephila pilipes]
MTSPPLDLLLPSSYFHPQLLPDDSHLCNVAQVSFPRQPSSQLPILGCNTSFGTKHWFHTSASIKHLSVFHRNKPTKVVSGALFLHISKVLQPQLLNRALSLISPVTMA